MGKGRRVQVADNLVGTRRATRVLRQLHAARKNLPKREHLQVALFLPQVFIIDVNVSKILTLHAVRIMSYPMNSHKNLPKQSPSLH